MPRKFPHLLKEDCALWQRFLDKYGSTYTYFLYDVRVGEGRDPGQEYDPHMRQMAVDLSQRRIDAVGISPDLITVIEISVNPGHTQVGQLFSYPSLYRYTFDYTGPLERLLVAETLQSDIQPVLEAENIPYVLI